MDSIIPDRSISVADGGLSPLGRIRHNRKFDILSAMSRKLGFSLYDPIESLPDEIITLLVFGSEEFFRIGDGADAEMANWPGLVEDIEDRIVCPVCHGTRLNPEAQCFKIDGKTITDVGSMEISNCMTGCVPCTGSSTPDATPSLRTFSRSWKAVSGSCWMSG